MDGECYRYCRYRRGAEATGEEKEIYNTLLDEIIELTKEWIGGQDASRFAVVFDGKNALELKVKNADLFNDKIVLPKELNEHLIVGWAHRCHGTKLDPTYEIAENIINLLLQSKLARLLEEECETDDIMEDCDYDSEEECEVKGLYHCSSGVPDSHWSPHGLYGGYDNYEDYLDANGIEVDND